MNAALPRAPSLVTRIREKGLARVGMAAVLRVASARIQVLLDHRSDYGIPVDAATNGLAFAEADIDDLARYDQLGLLRTERDRRAAADRFRRGDTCVVGRVGECPVTYLWCTSVLRELPRCPLPLSPTSMFIYKTFTLPEWRGHGFNRAALAWMLRHGYRRGVRTAFIDVAAANTSSLRAIHAVGFREIGRFYIVKAGPLAYTTMPASLRRRVCSSGDEGGDARNRRPQ